MTCRKAVSQSALPQRRSYSYPAIVGYIWQSCHEVDLQTTCRKAVLQSACHKGGLTTSLPPWWSYGSHATNWTYRRHALQFSRHTGGLTASLPPWWPYGRAVSSPQQCSYSKPATAVVLWRPCHKVGLQATCRQAVLQSARPNGGLIASLPP